MATPSSVNAAILPGNLQFSDGGMPADFLTGAFIKSISTAGVATVQMPNGSESTVTLNLASGHGTGPSFPGSPQFSFAEWDHHLADYRAVPHHLSGRGHILLPG